MGPLVRKLLRDVRLPLLVVALLLLGFQCLWAKITDRISGELVPTFTQHMPLDFIKEVVFKGPGKLVQTIMGGEAIHLDRAVDMLTIGYVHPLMLAIFCIWAIGRAAGAIVGEIDRGTMELLLAQPLEGRLVTNEQAHLTGQLQPPGRERLRRAEVAAADLRRGLVALRDHDLRVGRPTRADLHAAVAQPHMPGHVAVGPVRDDLLDRERDAGRGCLHPRVVAGGGGHLLEPLGAEEPGHRPIMALTTIAPP